MTLLCTELIFKGRTCQEASRSMAIRILHGQEPFSPRKKRVPMDGICLASFIDLRISLKRVYRHLMRRHDCTPGWCDAVAWRGPDKKSTRALTRSSAGAESTLLLLHDSLEGRRGRRGAQNGVQASTGLGARSSLVRLVLWRVRRLGRPGPGQGRWRRSAEAHRRTGWSCQAFRSFAGARSSPWEIRRTLRQPRLPEKALFCSDRRELLL